VYLEASHHGQQKVVQNTEDEMSLLNADEVGEQGRKRSSDGSAADIPPPEKTGKGSQIT